MQMSSINNDSCRSQFRCLSWLKEKVKACVFLSRSVTAQPSSEQNKIPRDSISAPYSIPKAFDEGVIVDATAEHSGVQDGDENSLPIPLAVRARDIIPDETGQLMPFKFKDLVIKKVKHVKCMIGKGGFGQVFTAVISPKKGLADGHQVDGLGRKKVSRIYAVKKGGWVSWFTNEARCLKAAGEFGYTPWYKRSCVVMHDKGSSLDKLISSGDEQVSDGTRRKLIPPSHRQSISKQAVQCLKRIHDKGILHSDIKSSNIAVNSRGEVSLIDFGVAVEAKGEVNGEKQFKLLTVTPECTSPEACGKETATQKMDVWAMGLVMFEMEMGYTPKLLEASELSEIPLKYKGLCMLKPEYRFSLFPKLNEERYSRVIEKINNQERISPECKQVLLACLARNPDERPTAEQLLKFPYFRDKELHEMSYIELGVAHSDAFKALVEAEKAMEESTSVEDCMLKDNLDRCQLRVRAIQERMKELDNKPEKKEDDYWVKFPRRNGISRRS